MFTKSNVIYSEAGKLLVSDKFFGYTAPIEQLESLHEEDITIDDIRVEGKYLVYSDGKVKQRYYPEYSRNDWKTAIIKSRYSNDDQIALILNKDDSEEGHMLFEKMQEWRSWASRLADKISTIK